MYLGKISMNVCLDCKLILSKISKQGVNQPPAGEQPNLVPNQPLDAPAEEPDHPNQPPILPDPMANQQLNWSYFKPEFAGKVDEDMEAQNQ